MSDEAFREMYRHHTAAEAAIDKAEKEQDMDQAMLLAMIANAKATLALSMRVGYEIVQASR